MSGKVLVTLFVKLSIPITQGAIDVHGITNQAVKDAPSFAEQMQLKKRLKAERLGQLTLL